MFVGKSEKGKVYHGVLVPKGKNKKYNHAACDQRQKGLVIDATLKADAITCSSCLKRVDVREAIKALEPKDKTTTGIPEASTMIVGKKPGAVGPSANDTPKETKQEEEVVVEGSIDEGDWRLRPDKKGSYSIVHLPSKKAFFNAIPKSIANDALQELVKIKSRWEGIAKPMPKDFVNNCRIALRKAYSTNNKVAPKYLLDPNDKKEPTSSSKETTGPKVGDRIKTTYQGEMLTLEWDGENYVPVAADKLPEKKKPAKKKRTIKRREKKPVEKKSKRKIKRRKPPEEIAEEVATAADKKSSKKKRKIKRRDKKDTLLGRTKGTPGHTVLLLMQQGSTMADLVAALVKNHGMTEKKAWTKIRAVIRKTARKQKVPVVIVMMDGDPGQDFYAIECDHVQMREKMPISV